MMRDVTMNEIRLYMTIRQHRRLHRILRQRIAEHVETIMNEMDPDEFKRLTKEAIHEWLDSQFAAFGRWTAMGILAATLAAVLTFILWSRGLPHG